MKTREKKWTLPRFLLFLALVVLAVVAVIHALIFGLFAGSGTKQTDTLFSRYENGEVVANREKTELFQEVWGREITLPEAPGYLDSYRSLGLYADYSAFRSSCQLGITFGSGEHLPPGVAVVLPGRWKGEVSFQSGRGVLSYRKGTCELAETLSPGASFYLVHGGAEESYFVLVSYETRDCVIQINSGDAYGERGSWELYEELYLPIAREIGKIIGENITE